MAAKSLLACAPVALSGCPRTPLRFFCIGAFEYVARLRGSSLDHRARVALAYACDFGALRNDFYDQGKFDRRSYRQLRSGLRRLVPETATHRYIRNLRNLERGRPAFGPLGFSRPAAVLGYRIRVLVLSLAWLRSAARRSMEPRFFRCLVALVGLTQLVDDLLDWKDDWACRRPTCVTAFLGSESLASRDLMMQIQRQANRCRRVLVAACDRDVAVAPLAMAGILVWFLASVLMKVRFPQ